MGTDSKLMFQHRDEYHDDKQTRNVEWGICNFMQGPRERVMQVFEAHGFEK